MNKKEMFLAGKYFTVGTDREIFQLRCFFSGDSIGSVWTKDRGPAVANQHLGNVLEVTNTRVHIFNYLMGKQVKYTVKLSDMNFIDDVREGDTNA